ncbi:LOW QUALITY PROTEIN: hypothetical protein PHAVU_003G255700 [Phaseolus vulgaris]|uniref:DUF4408 domain-containing protein n=1 Tax=Phaseolus vulgaris TaxID=3885 RepID=V7CFD4_PHAVU|nr:hypothetical protein PHAVU_003G255700g [Phaseolus vulgaris]ESW28063.1 hypothetical protein PHAVU_003G255700g [Phaseolus vulgaris]
MDQFLFKAEKANAIQRHNLFAAVSKTLRILELCLLLLLLSWLLTRLPFVFALSAQFLTRLLSFAASPLFVFALSNAIIAALLAQSRRFSAPHSAADALYHDFLNTRTPSLVDPAPTTKFRRSKSENWKGDSVKTPRRRHLRRSETEKRRENPPENLYPQDKLSNEEFQRAIEAFIAKQLRFLREESSAIVVQNPS